MGLNLTKAARAAALTVASFLLLATACLLFLNREDRVDVLFAVNGDSFDQAAYDHFRQTLAANVDIHKKPLTDLSERQLRSYDAIYLDYTLKHTDSVRTSLNRLMKYVEQGGHLFLENEFSTDFPTEFLGAASLVDLPPPKDLKFTYPEVDPHLRGLQEVFRLFVDSFSSQMTMESMPGFQWGKGLQPSTAQTLVSMNGASIVTANRYGAGSVLLSSAFLPNHYYITGFDMQSGMDPAHGFEAKIKASAEAYEPKPGDTYFHFKHDVQPLQPYFNFAFATANYQLRSEFLAYVSKEKLGYSIRKVHGPYGRPAMAHQNHFEVASAFKKLEGIQWTELLKQYNQIPSFSLVRSAYEWNYWFEDITVHLNTGSQAKPEFIGELPNSFYGSGARLASEGKPLTLAPYPMDKPHPVSLSGSIDLPYRAYPALVDLDGDGALDLLAGSAEGTLEWFRNLGPKPEAYKNQPLPAGLQAPDAFAAKQPVLTTGDKPLQLQGGYAAPAVLDANGDGRPDLVLGDGQGNVWLSLNQGDGVTFTTPKPLIDTAGNPIRIAARYAAPTIGDWNGDGIPDLILGSGDGKVTGHEGFRQGQSISFKPATPLVQLEAGFTAPSLRDLNEDGKPDLAVGNHDGDIQVFYQQDNGIWSKQGPITGKTRNQLGTNALVGGHNSVPLWYDINRDGKDDLIVGQLEFGLPTTLDDPVFPYAKELREFLDYSKENHLDIYPHLFFHSYASKEQEQEEIRLHREMFKNLGLPWTLTGTNQHTWRINNPDRLQTLRNENEQDIWFNFGFRPSNHPLDPRDGREYIWGAPFLLNDKELKHPMVLHTPMIQLRLKNENASTEEIYAAYTKLDMPIIYFEHVEYKFPSGVNDLLRFVTLLDKVRKNNDYNFMTEPQAAQSFLTTLTAKVTVKQSWGMYLWNKVKDKIGQGKHLTLTLKADTSDVPEHAGSYRDTLGVAIEPGKPYKGQPFTVDSDIHTEQAGIIYTGLQRPTKLTIDWGEEPFHIIRSNVPTVLTQKKDHMELSLKADGMQQVKLYSTKPLQIEGDKLQIEHNEADHTYTITHFGAQTTIKLRP